MSNNNLLVIGSGIAGLTAAQAAAKNGFTVHLVEKDGVLGGKAATYACKATNNCAKCSACLVLQVRATVEAEERIKVYLHSRVSRCGGQPGNYQVQLKTPAGEVEIKVAGIIVAAGFSPLAPEKRGELGLGWQRGVISALELEQALAREGKFVKAYPGVQKIGFVQCVGSRDLTLGNEYCSQVCCMYALRLARKIKHELPDSEIAVFYMDIQTFGRSFDKYLKEIEEVAQIKLVRGIPAKVFSFPYEKVTVRYTDSLSGRVESEQFDLLVLSTAITPENELTELAQTLGIEQNRFGFLANLEPGNYQSSKKGIYVCGTCQGPKSISDSIAQAMAVVGQLLTDLAAR
ncbi:MAG: FAD-dependent oxidoreductase [Bacillota bacterium]